VTTDLSEPNNERSEMRLQFSHESEEIRLISDIFTHMCWRLSPAGV